MAEWNIHCEVCSGTYQKRFYKCCFECGKTVCSYCCKDHIAKRHKAIISISRKGLVDVDSQKSWGCTFLDDKKYAIASNNNTSVIVLTTGGLEDFRVNVKPYGIIDIVYIPSLKIIAATTGTYGDHQIILIDLNTRTITPIPVKTVNYGIALHDDKLVYCALGRGLMIMNMKDYSIKPIDIKSMSHFAYVSSHCDNLYYTNGDYNTVTCCDINGKTKWQFKEEDVLRCPRGICVDGDGSVYVVGELSANLVVISHDGSSHFELLRLKVMKLFQPVIDYDRENDILLVVNRNEKVLSFQKKIIKQ